MFRIIKLFSIISPLFFCVNLLSQTDIMNYEYILSEDGLSQNTIHAILQDQQGFIWFATEDGLNKYDGYNFTVYKNYFQDQTSISDNFIWTIFEDKKGTIWIGTNSGGLCKFDKEKEIFTTYKNNPDDPNSLSHNNIRAIYEDSDENLWIGTEGGGLDLFDRGKNVFKHFKHERDNLNSISNNVILTIYEDRDKNIWVGSNGGLDKFDKKNNTFYNYSYDETSVNSISNDIVFSIYQDRSGRLWIGTLNGLNLFDIKKNQFTRFLMSSEEVISNSSRINSIIEDKSGTLFIGTGSGLYQFDKYSAGKPELIILNKNNILSVFEDYSGLIWIGTAEDGIVKFDRERIKFNHIQHDPFNNNSLSHNTIRAIFQEEDGILWIGTLGGGLNRFDPKAGIFTHIVNDHENKNSLSDNSVSAIYKDSYGYLWVGTWRGGLNRSVQPVKYFSGNIKFKNYDRQYSTFSSVSNKIIQAIYEDSEKRIWVGTGSGLDLYIREKDTFVTFSHNPLIKNSLSGDQVQSSVIQDRNGNIWIGTWNGLNKLTREELKKDLTNTSDINFIHYRFNPEKKNSLSDDRVISSYEDPEGNLWFGTYGGGLNKLTPDQQNLSEPEFASYTIQDGLPSNVIYAIQGDSNGNIWLSTDNGLSMFNPVINSFKNFDVNDGLQGNQFYWGASFKGKNGELLFGGTRGLNIFSPSDLKNNDHIPPVVITNFQIFNKPVEINTDNSPLKKNISETEEIELTYSQNVFSFEFAALDFKSPNKNSYAYMMEGFDNDWIYSGKRRFVTYTNLDPGEYIFKVKGSNNDGIWNEAGTSILIRILPPLWKTWWFILLSAVTVIGIISLIIYYRIQQLIKIERFRAKIAADLHDNIGSSLTEISILSEVVSRKLTAADNEIKKSLKMISTSSRNLIDSMSDIVWLVNPKKDSLYDLILRLRDTYSELSSYTNISFRSENIISLKKVSLSMEHRQHLYLLFKEAINNSITHSGCSEITLDASVKGRKLEMVLKDNGKGFCEDEVVKGNGLDNIKNRAKVIGGSVNINSDEGKGTTILFEGNII